MKNIRTIARLDVKGNNLIKSICLEGLRKVGIPSVAAKNYYGQDIDEIIYIDLVASLYGRSQMNEIVSETINDVFIPLQLEEALEILALMNVIFFEMPADSFILQTTKIFLYLELYLL